MCFVTDLDYSGVLELASKSFIHPGPQYPQ